jgi:hypothetical protein
VNPAYIDADPAQWLKAMVKIEIQAHLTFGGSIPNTINFQLDWCEGDWSTLPWF